jgi:N4-(beta-N-acetylglucosaminyl)-L-asparaginase
MFVLFRLYGFTCTGCSAPSYGFLKASFLHYIYPRACPLSISFLLKYKHHTIMFNRRQFLRNSALSSLVLLVKNSYASPLGANVKELPLVISTWPNVKSNAEAWRVLQAGGRAVDAVEAGVQIAEADPADQSVGYGGLPDRDGKVTLDACIMDDKGNCGSVMFLEGIKHPIRVARLVMEKTPHIQLVGEGALQFALANGFKVESLLTPESEKAWKDWLKTSKYDPMDTDRLLRNMGKDNIPGQQDNHDTIGMVALDAKGNLGGACTTSGMAFKLRGRVGDSPIIGSGLYVDNEVGAATATGVGEEVVRICGSHTVVELMRQGNSPEQACKKALERLVRMRGDKVRGLQVGLLAVNRKGEFGGYSLQKDFSYAVHTKKGSQVFQAKSLWK